MSEEANIISPKVFARRLQSFLQVLTDSKSLELDQDLIDKLYDAYANRSNPNESFKKFVARVLNLGSVPTTMSIGDAYDRLIEFNYSNDFNHLIARDNVDDTSSQNNDDEPRRDYCDLL